MDHVHQFSLTATILARCMIPLLGWTVPDGVVVVAVVVSSVD